MTVSTDNQSRSERPALFLDRDGIVNEDSGYVHRIEQIRFVPGIFELCRLARTRQYRLVVVTNQSGVARGTFTEADVGRLHEWMAEQFEQRGIHLDAFYYCPYLADAAVKRYRQDSDMRKPRPGMLLAAQRDLGIDLARSVMVGDKPSDRIQLPGLRSIIVRSRYTGHDYDVEDVSSVAEVL